MKRSASLLTAASVAVAASAFALTGASAGASSASASSALPVVSITMNGKSISVGGSTVSGAVDVHSTTAGEQFGSPTLIHLNAGVTPTQVFASIGHANDPNGVQPFGAIVFNAGAPRGSSDAQTVLPAGNYIALDTSKQNPPFPTTTFTVSQSSAPAALPAASATQSAIEFGFRGPTVLHNGTIVRAQDQGWLVHMIQLIGVRNPAAGRAAMELLRAGKDKAAGRFFTHAFAALADPFSHGAVQQLVLHTQPGWYVEACFMDTQDHREHTQLGMERLIRVVN
jgi:hypothetical protein